MNVSLKLKDHWQYQTSFFNACHNQKQTLKYVYLQWFCSLIYALTIALYIPFVMTFYGSESAFPFSEQFMYTQNKYPMKQRDPIIAEETRKR